MRDWSRNEIACAHSKGGVVVTAHPFDNLIRTGCAPWPPSEIVQKLYQSRQIRAFTGEDEKTCISGLGFYCDLQSIHSEDAFTDITPEGIAFRSTTWEHICSLASHPCAEELRRYFNWKKEHTRTANQASEVTARKLAEPQG